MGKGKARVFPATTKGCESFMAIVAKTPQQQFSKRRRAFIGRFEDAIIGDTDLTGNEKVAALAIARHIYARTNVCWASFSTLAHFCGTSKRSFMRHEKTVISSGWFAKLKGDGSRIERPGYGRYRFTNHYCINPEMVPEESVHKTKQLQRKGVSELSPLDAESDDVGESKASNAANGDLGVTNRAVGVSELSPPSDSPVTQTSLGNPPESKPAVGSASRRFMNLGEIKNQLGLIKQEITRGTVDQITAAVQLTVMMEWAHDNIVSDEARRVVLNEITLATFDLDALRERGR